jgi:hypothetical protein
LTLRKSWHSSWANEGLKINPNFHLDNLSDFLNKSLLEAEDGLPFLIRKEQKEILVEGLLIQKVGKVLKKFEGAINEKQ